MNERIKELAHQAGLEQGQWANADMVRIWKESSDNPGALNKFAELIVKECVSICENSEIPFDIEVWRDSTKKEMTALTAIALGNLIKAHFGVK
jgi:ferritin-like protein